MVYYYDNYLSNLADMYYAPCEPEIIDRHLEYEGEGEYSTRNIYNCESCDEKDCEFWKQYRA